MLRKTIPFLLAALFFAAHPAGMQAAGEPAVRRVVVIPIREEIAEPTLYILRHGLKEAMAEKADLVVLDLKTPGGAIDVTMEILEAMGKYPGPTIAYVDNKAMSAGAFVSAVTGEIWFAPDGIIGAAAPVTSTGQDVDATMKQKLVSYLKARMRSISEGKGYRGQVVSAMIDSDAELKIAGTAIKEKGELLSLTAAEAMKAYGDPAQPLLGAGIAPDIDALLTRKFGANGYSIHRLRITWSEDLSVLLNRAAPVLLGLGLLSLFIGYKTGSFGVFGIAGVCLLALVFLGSSVAGLSGHEPAILFGLGVVMLLLELLFFHTAGFLGIAGGALMLAALFWSMSDLWPNEPLTIAWSADAFEKPAVNLGLGILIAVALGAALLRYLPHGWIWDRLVVEAKVGGTAQVAGSGPGAGPSLDALVGREGIVATALRPAGQIVVEGKRYEATVEVGTVEAGSAVVVRGRTDFGLLVERVNLSS